jgi:peptide chain release factor 1
MLERLKEIAKKHEDLLVQQADPEIAVDPNRSREIAQKLAELSPVVAAYREYSTITDELEGAREIIAEADDEEMRQMAEAEVDELNTRCEEIEQRLKLLLLPVDPNDRRTRRLSSPPSCCACTGATPRRGGGSCRSPIPRTPASAVSKRRWR